MKTFDVGQLAISRGGEYVLGMKDLHTSACYMIYGVLQPSEGQRLVKPGEGHEEILCAVDGPILMHLVGGEVLLHQGQAMHVKESDSFFISNPSERTVVYVMAGGHSQPHH